MTRRKKWTEVSADWYYLLPHRPGCYAYILDDRHVYVGSSRDIASRFFQHGIKPSWGSSGYLTPWGTCRKLRVKYKVTGYYRQLEERLIKRIKPSLNCQHSTRRTPAGVVRVGGFPIRIVATGSGAREGFASVDEFISGDVINYA